MANPLFLFFATKAGWAATVLRTTVATFLLIHAYGELQFLLQNVSETPGDPFYSWMRLGAEAAWPGTILGMVFGVGMLAGFFTRLFAFALLCFLLIGIFSTPVVDSSSLREAVLFASLTLAVLIAGGGAFSIDRKISDILLPTFG